MRNMIVGLAIAGALGLVMTDASIGGIEVWKILLAVIGLAVFVMGGRTKASPPT
jgi:hypothetical protein